MEDSAPETGTLQRLQSLSDLKKKALFWALFLPGDKSVTGYRNLLSLKYDLRHQSRNPALEACKDLESAGCLKHKGSYEFQVGKAMFLPARRFSCEELAYIAKYAEENGLWPDARRLEEVFQEPGFRYLTAEHKYYYAGQERLDAAIMLALRVIFCGIGALPENTSKDREFSFAVAMQLVKVVSDPENLFALPGGKHLSFSFALLLADVAFACDADIRKYLECLIDHMFKNCLEADGGGLVELASLCLWSGRLDVADKLADIAGIPFQAADALDAIVSVRAPGGVKRAAAVVSDFVLSGCGKGKCACLPAMMLLDVALMLAAGYSQKFALTKIPRLVSNPKVYAGSFSHPLSAHAGSLLNSCISGFWRFSFATSYGITYGRTGISSGNTDTRPVACILGDVLCALIRAESRSAKVQVLQQYASSFQAGYRALETGKPSIAAIFACVFANYAESLMVERLMAGATKGGAVQLLEYVAPEPTWMKGLSAVASVLDEPEKKRKGQKARDEEEKGYFAWRLEPSYEYGMFGGYDGAAFRLGGVEPYFRRERDGKLIDLRLSQMLDDAYAKCRTLLDMELLANAFLDFDCGGQAELEARFGLLAKHPHILWAEDKHSSAGLREVRLVKRAFQLSITKNEDGSISFAVPKWWNDACADWPIALVHESETTIAWYAIGEREKKIAKAIAKYGSGRSMLVPQEAEGSVRVVAAKAAKKMSLGGNIGKTALAECSDYARIDADPTPVVRLIFENGGLSASLGIRPYPGADFMQLDEEDGRIVEKDGEPAILSRDMAKEAETFAPVYEILRSASGEEGESPQYFIQSLESSLSVVSSLGELGDKVCVEWPRGGKIEISDLDDKGANFSTFKAERNWFGVQGRFTLDSGKVLDIIELLRAMEESHGTEFVRLKSGDFLRISKALKRRMESLKAAGKMVAGGIEVTNAAIPMLAKEFSSDGEEGSLLPEALRESARKMAEIFNTPIKVPQGLNAKLRPYQEDGYKWLSRHAQCGFGACLADDMGLGKTLQIISLLLERSADGPSLVVAPASVCGNWRAEMNRFAPSLKPHLAWEFPAEQDSPFEKLGPRDVLVASYGLVVRRPGAFASCNWNGVVLDEAQAIKNHDAKRARCVKALSSRFRIAATGTPVENKLEELWSIFDFLNPGLLGAATSFTERLVENGMASDALKRLVAPFILRRLKRNVLKDLPPKTEITLPVILGAEERSAYEACRIHALEKLKGNREDRISILAELTRLRRFCCHPSLVFPDLKVSAKLEALKELLSDLRASNHRALVFSQFTDYLAIVRKLVEENGWSCKYLDGSTPIAERGKAVAGFQSGEGDFFLISLKAGGMGLNLTAANYVVILDPWWNPAVEDQASDRAHRIGQENPVTVYRLIEEKTVEERVLELHAEKRRISEDVLEGTASTKLTPDELMKLFAA